MAGAAPAWSSKLAIRLVRGLPGTREVQRRTIRALGFRKCNKTVFWENSSTIRGMINQVKRHLLVETEEMYKLRVEAEVQRKALRPPILIEHETHPRT